jgi:hypothetical protein
VGEVDLQNMEIAQKIWLGKQIERICLSFPIRLAVIDEITQ